MADFHVSKYNFFIFQSYLNALQTALHISAECGHMSNVKLLLQYGAKLTAKDKLGLTPLDLAEKSEQKECVPFLKQVASMYT